MAPASLRATLHARQPDGAPVVPWSADGCYLTAAWHDTVAPQLMAKRPRGTRDGYQTSSKRHHRDPDREAEGPPPPPGVSPTHTALHLRDDVPPSIHGPRDRSPFRWSGYARGASPGLYMPWYGLDSRSDLGPLPLGRDWGTSSAVHDGLPGYRGRD